jgi:hypothetical protein
MSVDDLAELTRCERYCPGTGPMSVSSSNNLSRRKVSKSIPEKCSPAVEELWILSSEAEYKVDQTESLIFGDWWLDAVIGQEGEKCRHW